MKIKYIISLGMLVALIGASCWSAAKNDKQRAQRIYNERLAEPFAQQEAPGAFEEMPREIWEFHILNHMPAAKLMEMAFEHPGLYKLIKTIPQFIQLEQNMNREFGRLANNKQKVFLEAARSNYPGAIDVIDYLAPDVNINAQDFRGTTALKLAVINNNLEMAELLLAKGADINVRDLYNGTALMWAASNNNLEMVELLLAKGAEINMRNRGENTALNLAKRNLTRVNLNSPDYINRVHTIIDLLTKGG